MRASPPKTTARRGIDGAISSRHLPSPRPHRPDDKALTRTLEIQDLTDRLLGHPLYSALESPDDLRRFMRAHVFCVWDFQSLLKALQRRVTCVEVPWMPSPDPEARRLVNEIVLDEESDITPTGEHLSHYELYVGGMRDAGADLVPIEGFVKDLASGSSWRSALGRADLPVGVEGFVSTTLELATQGETHCIAAGFAYGREEVIPDMFRSLVARLAERSPERWGTFRYYLERHIECDEDEHGPAARALVSRLCGDDSGRWDAATRAARRCLQAREELWGATLEAMSKARGPA